MVNCLAGCIANYAAGYLFSKSSEDKFSSTMSPIIKADIFNGEIGITVGNESYPYRENKACIKSINFGFNSSMEGNMEIIDEEGGALSVFIEALRKCAGDGARSIIKYQIGWVYSKCDYPYSRFPVKYSPIMENTINKIDTNFSEGIIKFNIQFSTIAETLQNARENKIFGEQFGGKKMHLNEAIRQLAAIEPKLNVKFARIDDDGKMQFFNGHKWAKYEPKAAWQADGLNRYSVIQKWVENFTVDNGSGEKGIVVIHSPEKIDEILILEDPSKEDETLNPKPIGTFIVNGGNCSNVLEFSPSLSLTLPNVSKSTGGSTNPNGSESELKVKDKKKTTDTDNIGTQQTIVISQQAQYVMGKDASKNTNAAQEKHSKANRTYYINFLQIAEAELKIVGSTMPIFYDISILSSNVSIVIINPFHIELNGNGCGDFLKKSSCHPTFSSKNWHVRVVHHSVQDGSFVTTLKVYASAPKNLRIESTCDQ